MDVGLFILQEGLARKFSASAILYTYLPMKMEQTDCSETSVYKIQTPGNYPEESNTTFRTRRKFEIKNKSCPCFKVYKPKSYITFVYVANITWGTQLKCEFHKNLPVLE
jgi:hypothetical protein